MLRIEVEDSDNALTLILQGRLVGEQAVNARGLLLTRYRPGMRLVVDLREVTFVDAAGEDLLFSFGGFDAEFIADTSYSRYICERLHLRVVIGELTDRNT